MRTCFGGCGRGLASAICFLAIGACSTFGPWPGGIGAVLRHTGAEQRLVVESVPSGGPAAEAGLRPGDEVVEIDGEPVAGMTVREVVEALRGEVGATVRLGVVRDGADPITIEVTRGPYRER